MLIFRPTRVDEGHDEIDPGLGDAHETAEMLEGVAVALVDNLDAHHHEQKRQKGDGSHERRQHVSSPKSLIRGMLRR